MTVIKIYFIYIYLYIHAYIYMYMYIYIYTCIYSPRINTGYLIDLSVMDIGTAFISFRYLGHSSSMQGSGEEGVVWFWGQLNCPAMINGGLCCLLLAGIINTGTEFVLHPSGKNFLRNFHTVHPSWFRYWNESVMCHGFKWMVRAITRVESPPKVVSMTSTLYIARKR